MPSQRVRIAMDAYDAWNRGDFDAMIELHFNGKGRESGGQITRIAGYPSVGDAREGEGLPEQPADAGDDRTGSRARRD
jgi:hypothetical protein